MKESTVNESTENEKSQKISICSIDLGSACCSICCSPTELISSIEFWWTQAFPIIEHIAAVTGAITGTAAITSWIRNKLSKNQKGEELIWVKIILREDEWNTSILASVLGLPEDEAKTILKGFGYIWNAKKMMYVATDATNKLRSIRISL